LPVAIPVVGEVHPGHPLADLCLVRVDIRRGDIILFASRAPRINAVIDLSRRWRFHFENRISRGGG
jgi:hypothetical protein